MATLCATLSAALLVAATVAPASAVVDDEVGGNSKGNHDLGCRVIEPSGPMPVDGYPLIVWADGWYQGNQNGADTTTGYLPGLEGWADEGYFVVAATQWSMRDTDVLRCLTWITDADVDADSTYFGLIDESKIGLAGHSQGAGAVLKAGDGEANGKAKGPTSGLGSFDITSVIAMNPYGPSFWSPADIDGPVLFLGGGQDTTTPTDSFFDAWVEVRDDGPGGLLAEYGPGDHNSEAFGDPADTSDFGAFQEITERWWQAVFSDGSETIDSIADDYATRSDWSLVDRG